MVYQSTPGENQIVSDKTAFMITDMLEAVVERGTARKANGALGKTVVFAGKTGSSKDGWFVGYTPNLVTVAWVGFDENEDIGATGGEIALPLWTDFMKSAIQIRPEFGGESFPMPKGLVTVEIDPETGMLATAYCPHSEKVVVPVSASANIKCLRHEPDLPDTLLAENTETGEFAERTIIIVPDDVSIETPEPENSKTKFERIDDMPTEVERKPVRIKPDIPEPVRRDSQLKDKKSSDSKTYWENYEMQSDGSR